ncbi:MAG: tetratricopeptide repeat protein [Thermoplasmata archaeon]|nr:tetratricopeptide repeat protein [Thermoplasmata archaeon]
MKIPNDCEFVGRKRYLEYLQRKLDGIGQHGGKIVVVTGDTGVGKTRIVEEFLKNLAGDVFVMKTKCFAGLSLPYTSIRRALEDQGLEALLRTAQNPRIEAIFAVTKSGLVVSKLERGETIDSDILLGMLNAVSAFVRESLSYIQKSTHITDDVQSMRYGAFNLLSVPGEHLNLVAVLTGKENENLIFEMDEILKKIEVENKSMLLNWDGNIGKTAVLTKYFSVLLTDGRYAGEPTETHFQRLNLYENILHGIKRKATGKKVLLYVDDLQWADVETLELLKFLVRNSGEMPVFVLCTYNENASNVQIERRTLEPLVRDGVLEFLKIEGLNQDEFVNFLGKLLGYELDEELVAKLFAETQGNPLFTIELLKDVDENEKLEKAIKHWDYEKNLPKRIYEILEERVHRLPREDIEILQCGAVEGYEFSPNTVARLLETSKLGVLRRLSSLETAGFASRVDENHYRFSHPMLRDAIYSTIDEGLKKAYHECLAEIYEADYLAGKHEAILKMEEHYLAAGITPKIEEFAVLAGRYALANFANEKAVEVLKRGLDKAVNPERRLEILKVLIDALETDARFREEIEFIDRMLEIIKTRGNDRDMAIALKKRAEAHIAIGDYAAAMKDVEHALSLETEPALRGRLVCIRGLVHERVAEHTEALKYYEEAIKILENTEAYADLAYGYMRLGTASHSLGRMEEGERNLKKALEIYTKIEDLRGISSTSNNLGEFYRGLGERENAREQYLRALEIDRRIGDRRGLSVVYSSLGDIALDYEEYAEALRNYNESLKLCRRIDNKYGIAWNLCGIAEALVKTGQLEGVMGNLTTAFEIANRINAKDVVGWAYRVHAVYEELTGNLAKARLLYEKSAGIYEAAGMEIERAKTLCEYGRMLVESDTDFERGVELLREAINTFTQKNAKNYLAKCERVMRKTRI